MSDDSQPHSPVVTPPRRLSDPEFTFGDRERDLIEHGYSVGWREGRAVGHSEGLQLGIRIGRQQVIDEELEKRNNDKQESKSKDSNS